MKVFYIGILMILIGVLLWLIKIYTLGTGLLLAGILLLISYIYHVRKPETETETIIDERVERINDKAGNYAFWITIATLSIVFWINFYGIKMNLGDIYMITLLAGIYSWIISRFYLSRRDMR